jgi:hypothetical protein
VNTETVPIDKMRAVFSFAGMFLAFVGSALLWGSAAGMLVLGLLFALAAIVDETVERIVGVRRIRV